LIIVIYKISYNDCDTSYVGPTQKTTKNTNCQIHTYTHTHTHTEVISIEINVGNVTHR